MGIVEKPWVILGTPLRCLGLPADAQSDLSALLQGFPHPETADGAVDFQFEDPWLSGGGSRWDLTGSPDPLSSHVEYRIVDEAIRRAEGRWVLHAGAVAGPERTCLIVGESGAGKTSLTLWLWASGLRLGTDDLCPIVHGSLDPEAFPRALHMDCEYSPELLARIPPRPASYPADYYPFPGGSGDPALPPVRDLLVLERGPKPEGELEPLGQSEAAHHLLKAIIRNSGFDFGRALDDMIRLAARIRAHRLRASTPEGAGARALELLAG
jgi:hypothetical protein